MAASQKAGPKNRKLGMCSCILLLFTHSLRFHTFVLHEMISWRTYAYFAISLNADVLFQIMKIRIIKTDKR